MERFLERNHDVRFDITPALGCCLASAEPNKRLEEIAEPGSAKFEFDPAVAAPILIKSAARLLRPPSGTGLKSTRLIPIRAKLIVFLSLLRIAQDFVGFVDFLKLFFGGLFVLRDIGMMFSRQLAKSGANLIFARCLLDAECFVIISKLHRHRLESLRTAPQRNYPLPVALN